MINNVLVWKQPNISWIHPINIDNSINANNFNFDYLDTLNKLRSSNLKILELRDIADKISDGPFGSQLKVEEYKEQGFPVYRVKNIIDTQILDDDIVYIDAKKQQQLKRSEVLPGDVLITKAGRIGSAAVVPSKFGNGNITSHLVLVRLKKTINNYYLVAYLECKYGKVITGRESYKSTRPELTKNEIGNVIIPIPSPEIQKYIGDKVRKAEELREEAKRLKKDAEEIIYKKLGNIIWEDEKNYTANYIREEDIFERIDSEYYKEKYTRLQKQLKSKGFSLKTLDELCDSNIFNGKTYKTTNKKRKYMNVGVGELGDWFILENRDKYIDENINTNYLLDRYSIIWGNSAHLAKYIGEKVNINLETNLYVPTTEITCIKPNLNKINPYYLFLYMKSNWGYYQIQRTVKGMTAHSYPEDVSKIIVPILDFSSVELNVMKSAIELGYRYTKESKQLIQEAKQDVEDLIEGNFDMSIVEVDN